MAKNITHFYKDKKVFITGHTGFKGSWLSMWLLKVGAEVYGYSKEIPTYPSLFELAGLGEKVNSTEGDILDTAFLSRTIEKIKPDIIFHFAAQPLVIDAINKPAKTYEINVLGMVSILETLRKFNNQCSLISITSDKSYFNKEWVWGYRETDEIGGKDPYSASKACAEIVMQSYFHTFFKDNSPIRLAVARAGNIIGGGDWAANRIIPDCIKSWKENKPMLIRSPQSIRPWQHVLDPLYGYLSLGMHLHNEPAFNGEVFNFGPNSTSHLPVISLVEQFAQMFRENGVRADVNIAESKDSKESKILKLNCEKALALLKWKPYLSIQEGLALTATWYHKGHWLNKDVLRLSMEQMDYFEKKLID